jgi:hypothetical protein
MEDRIGTRADDKPTEPPLPYGGDIQEAIRKQDREAVKKLLAVRTVVASGEHKGEEPSADVLHEALVSLGFPEVQVLFPALCCTCCTVLRALLHDIYTCMHSAATRATLLLMLVAHGA